MKKVFILIIVLSAIALGGGYYFGRFSPFKVSIERSTNGEDKATKDTQRNMAVSPAANSISLPAQGTYYPTLTTPPSPKTQTLHYKIGESSYSVNTPLGWHVSQEKENLSVVTTITNGNASLVIRAIAATEGVPCGYKDAPITPSEMFPDVSSYTYDLYTGYTGVTGHEYRRADNTANPSTGKSFFVVCEKRGSEWSQPTNYGFVNYEVPYSQNPETDSKELLETLDGIFSSITVD